MGFTDMCNNRKSPDRTDVDTAGSIEPPTRHSSAAIKLNDLHPVTEDQTLSARRAKTRFARGKKAQTTLLKARPQTERQTDRQTDGRTTRARGREREREREGLHPTLKPSKRFNVRQILTARVCFSSANEAVHQQRRLVKCSRKHVDGRYCCIIVVGACDTHSKPS
jgi:hypothetical protein